MKVGLRSSTIMNVFIIRFITPQLSMLKLCQILLEYNCRSCWVRGFQLNMPEELGETGLLQEGIVINH